MNRWGAGDFSGSEATLYKTIMVEAGHCIVVLLICGGVKGYIPRPSEITDSTSVNNTGQIQ